MWCYSSFPAMWQRSNWWHFWTLKRWSFFIEIKFPKSHSLNFLKVAMDISEGTSEAQGFLAPCWDFPSWNKLQRTTLNNAFDQTVSNNMAHLETTFKALTSQNVKRHSLHIKITLTYPQPNIPTVSVQQYL